MSLRRPCLVVASLVALTACALGTQRFGRSIEADRIASLQVGRSTKADVLRLFGPPTAYSGLPPVPVAREEAGASRAAPDTGADANALVYEYREDRESFFTVFVYTRFRREVVADRLVVFFDERDVVKYVAFAQETAEPAP